MLSWSWGAALKEERRQTVHRAGVGGVLRGGILARPKSSSDFGSGRSNGQTCSVKDARKGWGAEKIKCTSLGKQFRFFLKCNCWWLWSREMILNFGFEKDFSAYCWLQIGLNIWKEKTILWVNGQGLEEYKSETQNNCQPWNTSNQIKFKWFFVS